MPEKYQNKYRMPSSRLQGYDYGQNGAYSITICTKNRICFFGKNISSSGSGTQNISYLRPTPIGVIANEYWQKIPEHFPFVFLDEFVIMPNHRYGIIVIFKETPNDASLQEIPYANKIGPQSGNISSVIGGYKAGIKSFATINNIDFEWQPCFHDRIIRKGNEMKRIRKYVAGNPENGYKDKNNKEDLYM